MASSQKRPPPRARRFEPDPPRSRKKPHAGSKPHGAAAEPRDRRTERELLRIAGLPAVAALFETAPARVERLFLVEALKGTAGAWCAALGRARKPYRVVPPEELTRIAGTPVHGGIVAVARPAPLPELDLAEAARWAAAGEGLLVLDGIGNPHNLGAVARTAAFLGVRRLLLSGHPAQALPSDAAYRVAEGGLDRIMVYRVPRLAEALPALGRQFRTVAAVAERGRPPEAIAGEGGRPIALVLGNEEEGLGKTTVAACGAAVTIPGAGAVQSLNVAAAAAILGYALLRPMPARKGASSSTT